MSIGYQLLVGIPLVLVAMMLVSDKRKAKQDKLKEREQKLENFILRIGQATGGEFVSLTNEADAYFRQLSEYSLRKIQSRIAKIKRQTDDDAKIRFLNTVSHQADLRIVEFY
jgi:hypothetical protein